jgi:hypothetical protein
MEPGKVSGKEIERRVMVDEDRPCLYGIRGPCVHPNCLEAHFVTLRELADRSTHNGELSRPARLK